ncbi:hypothetical protein QAD02_022471 [Eretmocerus hayati]|uniref:Uncharacterized protein n=1 Tax=Eretmocerus hayati TaxID=131215 RepID=A0ACC2PTD1_9HYME|nr:hypothetical protein QAD02_022471 [Eretmocerus hayati]
MDSGTGKSKKPVRVGFYDIEGTIGKGNFAVVKYARHRITKTEVAIKMIDKGRLDPINLAKVYREVEIMKQLKHPHIVKLYQVMETDYLLYMVCEYVSNGEIFDYIKRYGRMDEPSARSVFAQIVSAVEYCHSTGVAHRDLKIENLLLDAHMNVKLADFGFSNRFAPGEMLSTYCGSPPYAAPEVFRGKLYDAPAIDVWSMGVVLFVLVCGALPFDGSTLQTLRERVLSGRFRVPYFVTTDCENLIRKMLVLDPTKRYTIPQIKRHHWMAGASDSVRTVVPPTIPPSQLEPNEHILGLIASLGIDAECTRVSLRNNSYDDHAAIYFLLLENVKQHLTKTRDEKFKSRARADAELERVGKRFSSTSSSTDEGCYSVDGCELDDQSQPSQQPSSQPSQQQLPGTGSGASEELREAQIKLEEHRLGLDRDISQRIDSQIVNRRLSDYHAQHFAASCDSDPCSAATSLLQIHEPPNLETTSVNGDRDQQPLQSAESSSTVGGTSTGTATTTLCTPTPTPAPTNSAPTPPPQLNGSSSHSSDGDPFESSFDSGCPPDFTANVAGSLPSPPPASLSPVLASRASRGSSGSNGSNGTNHHQANLQTLPGRRASDAGPRLLWMAPQQQQIGGGGSNGPRNSVQANAANNLVKQRSIQESGKARGYLDLAHLRPPSALGLHLHSHHDSQSQFRLQRSLDSGSQLHQLVQQRILQQKRSLFQRQGRSNDPNSSGGGSSPTPLGCNGSCTNGPLRAASSLSSSARLLYPGPSAPDEFGLQSLRYQQYGQQQQQQHRRHRQLLARERDEDDERWKSLPSRLAVDCHLAEHQRSLLWSQQVQATEEIDVDLYNNGCQIHNVFEDLAQSSRT